MSEKRDLVIIGGGPGGYVAALRAAQLRKKVTLVEDDRIGGTCMNYGCIPTKFLLSQTKTWSELKNNQRIEGWRETVRLDWASVQKEKRAVVDRLVRGTEFLLERNGIEILKGRGGLRRERGVLFRGPDGERALEAEKLILATGSRSADLPFLKPDGNTVDLFPGRGRGDGTRGPAGDPAGDGPADGRAPGKIAQEAGSPDLHRD